MREKGLTVPDDASTGKDWSQDSSQNLLQEAASGVHPPQTRDQGESAALRRHVPRKREKRKYEGRKARGGRDGEEGEERIQEEKGEEGERERESVYKYK